MFFSSINAIKSLTNSTITLLSKFVFYFFYNKAYNITMRKKYNLTNNQMSFFIREIKKIIYDEKFYELRLYKHHGSISTYTHVIKVAYISYCFAIKYNIKVNHCELIRAALLHDLYFYDWHDKNNGVHLHGLFHSKLAVKNAKKYFNINSNEEKHMKTHMFPLTLMFPTTKAGWIICYADKVAARSDYKAIKCRKKGLRKLSII